MIPEFPGFSIANEIELIVQDFQKSYKLDFI